MLSFFPQICDNKMPNRRARKRRSGAAGGYLQTTNLTLTARGFFDYDTNGQSNAIMQMQIDPIETVDILKLDTGLRPMLTPKKFTLRVMQPMVGATGKNQGDQAFNIRVCLPMMYPTGVGGTGFAVSAPLTSTYMLLPTVNPRMVDCFTWDSTKIPRNAVPGMTDKGKHMVLASIQVLNQVGASQAICNLRFEWEFRFEVPVPAINSAVWGLAESADGQDFDKVVEGGDIVDSPAFVTMNQLRHGNIAPLGHAINSFGGPRDAAQPEHDFDMLCPVPGKAPRR